MRVTSEAAACTAPALAGDEPGGPARPRAVITGVGVVSPIGVGKDEFWNNLLQGRSGVDFLRGFPNLDLPLRYGAEVRNFDAAEYIRQKKLLKVMSRDVQLGVSAAELAVRDAGILPGDVDPDRFGVEFGAGHIPWTPSELEEAARACIDPKPGFDFSRFGIDAMEHISPLWLLRHLPNMPACQVAIEHDARGPNNTITSRDSSAILALAEAIRAIERGVADVMIVGACSSNIQPMNIARLSLWENLSRHEGDPRSACRPFDMNRDGTIVGEGAAAFVVESARHARARGAEIYAEILGVSAGCDGRSAADGVGLARAIRGALRQARIDPAHLGHINAHGKSTRRDDCIEARAYHRALGAQAERIPVTGLKSYFGSFDAGSGAVELAGSVLALRNGYVPMTLNYQTPDPDCRVNVVRGEPAKMATRTALSVNRTEMGQCAAAILRSV